MISEREPLLYNSKNKEYEERIKKRNIFVLGLGFFFGKIYFFIINKTIFSLHWLFNSSRNVRNYAQILQVVVDSNFILPFFKLPNWRVLEWIHLSRNQRRDERNNGSFRPNSFPSSFSPHNNVPWRAAERLLRLLFRPSFSRVALSFLGRFWNWRNSSLGLARNRFGC